MGGSALARAAVYGTTPPGWYLPRPRGADGWRSHAEVVRSGFPGTRWLEALRPAIAPSGAAAERLARVASGHGVLVTTGQQPGLFGGPGYTWLKALSALALADKIEREIGIPAAPLFWAATDDADFQEASFTHVNVGAECRRIQIVREGAEGLVMSQMPLGAVHEQLAALLDATGSSPQGSVLAALQRAYHPDATVGGAYVSFMRSVLEPLGIGVLDAWHPTVRSAARSTLGLALNRASAIDEAVALRMVSIERAGYRAQVARVPKLSAVFRSKIGIKERVPLSHAGDAAMRDDLVLSPTVLLRPVIERCLLPSVAYVGGPGEVAYFAQVGAVAEAMGVAIPLVVPRWSATVVEPAVDRMLGRLGMVYDDVRAPHEAERRIGERAMPAAIRESLAELRDGLEARMDALVASQQGRRLVPDEVLEGSRKQFRLRIERIERRLRAAVTRQEAAAVRDLASVRAALVPDGERQERRLNLVPLLARHGESLLTQLKAGATQHANAIFGVK